MEPILLAYLGIALMTGLTALFSGIVWICRLLHDAEIFS